MNNKTANRERMLNYNGREGRMKEECCEEGLQKEREGERRAEKRLIQKKNTAFPWAGERGE